MRRALAISSEGMLSDSQRKALTLLSLGMLVLSIEPPIPVIEVEERRGGVKTDLQNVQKRLLQEDDEILSIIYTFMKCQ